MAAGNAELGDSSQKALKMTPPVAEVKAAPVVGIAWDLVNQDARRQAQTYTYDLVRGITDNTRQRLQQQVDAWIAAGNAFPDLVERVKPLIPDLEAVATTALQPDYRARLIAMTESTRAYADGNQRVWEAAGVWGREWRTAVDERVCPVCGALHQQRAKLGEDFAVTVKGKRVVVRNPPAHPGCRCSVKPVVRPERSPTPGTGQERIIWQGQELTVPVNYRPAAASLTLPEQFTRIGEIRLTGERRQHYQERHPETSRLSPESETRLLHSILLEPELRVPDPKNARNERRYVQYEGKWWRAVVGLGTDGQWFVLSFQRVHGPGK